LQERIYLCTIEWIIPIGLLTVNIITTMALSSITKKLIMSISGLFLILFLLLHTTINFFAVVDAFKGTWGAPAGEGWYAGGCWFMATPVIDIMVPVLAAGFFVHIIYAFILTIGNYKARGTQRYAIPHQGKAESWASKNMLVLGVIVLGFAAFHMSHFWAEMQYVEWFKGEHVAPESVYALMEITFGKWWMVAIYIVWFAALWFHLTHGFWSALQTIGWSNQIWEKRLECAGKALATLFFVCLTVTAIVAYCVANGIIPGSVLTCCCGGC
jgi:succinate dehydrogenase / fumarate reductase cytochrome b subunit